MHGLCLQVHNSYIIPFPIVNVNHHASISLAIETGMDALFTSTHLGLLAHIIYMHIRVCHVYSTCTSPIIQSAKEAQITRQKKRPFIEVRNCNLATLW